MRRRIIVLVLVVIAAGGVAWWWFGQSAATNGALTLYGNVDLRQVDVAFNDSGRVDTVLVDEGMRVKAGDVVARLDTSRLTPQVAQAKAQAAAAAAVLEKLKNGTRPEEIAQAQANVDAALAAAKNATLSYDRYVALNQKGQSSTATVSQVDAARAAKDTADAQLEVARQALKLATAGPRAEDIAQAQAQLDAANAQLALLEQQLADAELKSPVSGTVRSRLLEPGEIASPSRPVFSIAITDPKWVRAYVSEPDLPRVHADMAATVTVDGEQDHDFTGHVGYISPVAEFTPRSVQTQELRTSLVYEVRILIDDPDDILKLGQPATVHLANGATADTPAS